MQLAVPSSLPLEFAATAVNRLLITGSHLLVGWAISETTGAAPAKVYLRDGERQADAPQRVPLTFGANESRFDSVTNLGIIFERALLLHVAAGSVEGTLFVIPTSELIVQGGVILLGMSHGGEFEPLAFTEGG